MKTNKFKTVYSFPSGNEVKIPTSAKHPILSSLILDNPEYDQPMQTRAELDLKSATRRMAADQQASIENSAVKPRHQHDCGRCQFLGTYKEYDLYFCAVANFAAEPTVIARFGEGGDYLSGMQFADNPKSPLYLAKQLAISKNLL